jgi:hypothetical protein
LRRRIIGAAEDRRSRVLGYFLGSQKEDVVAQRQSWWLVVEIGCP